jgi:hypothetical protein
MEPGNGDPAMIEGPFKQAVDINSLTLFQKNQWSSVEYRPAYLNARQAKKLNNNWLEVA